LKVQRGALGAREVLGCREEGANVSEGIGREAGEGERPLLVVKLLADRALAAAIHHCEGHCTLVDL